MNKLKKALSILRFAFVMVLALAPRAATLGPPPEPAPATTETATLPARRRPEKKNPDTRLSQRSHYDDRQYVPAAAPT
jgi:hypothetical protein